MYEGRSMKYLFALCLALFLVLRTLSWATHLQEIGEREPEIDCTGRGQFVRVNGEIVGCTRDEQTAGNTYRPAHGVLSMRDIPELNDDWMDGK
jgi:hypothetical protein